MGELSIGGQEIYNAEQSQPIPVEKVDEFINLPEVQTWSTEKRNLYKSLIVHRLLKLTTDESEAKKVTGAVINKDGVERDFYQVVSNAIQGVKFKPETGTAVFSELRSFVDQAKNAGVTNIDKDGPHEIGSYLEQRISNEAPKRQEL